MHRVPGDNTDRISCLVGQADALHRHMCSRDNRAVDAVGDVKHFLLNDRVRRSVLRGTRCPISIPEVCQRWPPEFRLRKVTRHPEPHRKDPSPVLFRQSPGDNPLSRSRPSVMARRSVVIKDARPCRCKAKAHRPLKIQNCRRDKYFLFRAGYWGYRCAPAA